MPFPDSVIQQVKERLDYEQAYGEFVRLTGGGPDRMALCVFHDNTDTPALSINVQRGVYKCFNPACSAHRGGDFIGFYMRVRDVPFPQAIRELARRVGLNLPDEPATSADVPPIDADVVHAHHQRLLATANAMTWLQEHRGLTSETVVRWQLGYDGQRYFIPIQDEAGAYRNIRRYKPNAGRAQDKMMSWRTGYGAARLWPYDSLELARTTGQTVLLCEGEMDCLLALQLGFCAITTTGGAGTWRENWNELFRGLDVAICYDVDDAGRRGALHIAHKLLHLARAVRVVAIPLTEPDGADFTDYIHGHGQSADDFRRLIDETPVFVASGNGRVEMPAEPTEPVDVHLSLASEARYYNQNVRTPVVLSGKTMAPYIVPKDVRLSCSMPDMPMCQRCPVAAQQGRLTHSLEFDSNEILQFVGVPDSKLQAQLKQKIGVPQKCTYVDIAIERSLNVEEIQLIPEIDHTNLSVEYVTRQAYYIGHGLKTNKSYTMTGLTVPHPKTQLATHIITSKVDAQSNIDAFRLTDDVVSRLRVFQPDEESLDGLWAKLGAIYDDLEKHTRIYQRRDLMLGVDLTYHSLLRFSLLGDMLTRGWVECLVIGDTRTGKTTIVERLKDYYGAGEVGSGENTSLAGLVGGLHQLGDAWVLQWGKIPLNDRRLYAIDEAGNLPPEQIARLSSMRSSGIAEVIKVHTERTSSRTRQIWISNPRGNKPLASYSQGVLAVKELIGAPEDIARFDLVVTAASDDVELSVINAAHEVEAPETFTKELCHDRVMWAWSRNEHQVQWLDGAERRVLDHANTHGRQYRHATEIPLVEPNEQRVKIARLAVAAAALFFSTSDGALVSVGPHHVDFAVQFLDRLYAKRSLAFTAYADAKRRQHELQDEDAVLALLQGAPDSIRQLMQQESLTQTDIAEILGIDDRATIREKISMLRKVGFLIRQGSSSYVKSPAAISFLRRLERDFDQPDF